MNTSHGLSICTMAAVALLCIGAVSQAQTCIGGKWDITSNIWFGDCTPGDQYDGWFMDGPLGTAYSTTASGDTTITLADGAHHTIYWKLFWYNNIMDQSIPIPDSIPLLAGVHCWSDYGSTLAGLLNAGNTYLDVEAGAVRVMSLTFSIDVSENNSGTWWWGSMVNDVPTSWAEDVIIHIIRERLNDACQLLANAGALELSGKHVDVNRVYLRGHSMGGTGAYRMGIKFPDIFAAIHCHAGFADFKCPCGPFGFDGMVGNSGQQCKGIDGNQYVARDYTDMSWFVRTHKGASWENMTGHMRTYEPPYVCMTHGTSDDAVPIVSADRVHHVLDSLKYGCTFWRHGAGHSDNNGTRSQWMLNFRKNQSYLALTNNSTNTSDHFNYLDQIGWQPSSIVDETDHYEVQMTGSSGTADVTLRRLQNFIVEPGKEFHYWIGTKSGAGTAVSADANGALTLTHISAGSKVIVEPDISTAAQSIGEALGKTTIAVSPNPFNPMTMITGNGWNNAEAGRIELRIYNTQGTMVQRMLVSASQLATGVVWDASHAAAGVYLIQAVAAGGQRCVSRAVLAR